MRRIARGSRRPARYRAQRRRRPGRPGRAPPARPLRSRRVGRARSQRRRGRQGVPPPARAGAHAQGACAAPVPAQRSDRLARARATSPSPSPQGEFFGIVGRNGSGKSTLLKCLAGIYRSTAGAIRDARPAVDVHRARRRLQPRPRRARQRRHQRRSCSASRPREARRRFDAIIAFAELEEFVDLKLKNYSSGMQVRLAFSRDDPGRRRRAAHRRGARRRRRGVPAEVLRRLPAHQGRGQDDPLRHPRHGRRAALLRPRAAARARPRAS